MKSISLGSQPLRPLALTLLTLGTTSLAQAQYGTTPQYGGSASAGVRNVPALPAQRATPQPVRPAPAATSALGQTLNNAERTQNSQALLSLYGDAVTTSDQARAAISQLLTNYYTLRNGAQTADQATQAVAEASLRFQVFQAAQNQVMVQQNQQILQQNARIIALLEAQNRARPNATR